MFGYCHDDECKFDIWSPDYVDTPTHHFHVLNRAFSPYAKHTQELEDVIQDIVEMFSTGYDGSFTISIDDSFSQEDVEYIEREVNRRLGY